MEQGSRLDSTPVSAGHDTMHAPLADTGRDAAITRMLTGSPQDIPDPIHAAIAECGRLDAIFTERLHALSGEPEDHPGKLDQHAAHDASWDCWREVVLTTVPRTAEGCRALAAYAGDWFKTQGGNDEDAETVLDLIARSPMLPDGAPTPADRRIDPPSKVEAELMALAAEYEGFAQANEAALDREDKAGLPLPHDLKQAFDKAVHYAHVGREDAVRHAMALPATTVLGFGLKAQILEHDVGSTWADNEDDRDVGRCRALLHGLIAAAGLSPIRHAGVTAEEICSWLADPSTAPGVVKAKG